MTDKTDKTDTPGTGQAKPAGESSAPKKPSALVDLKATAVAAKDAGAAKPGGDPNAPKADEKGEAKPAQASSPSGSDRLGAQSADPPWRAIRKSATEPAGASRAGPEKPSSKSGGKFPGLFTHLAAGVAGGFLALLGAETIGPQLGLTGAPWTEQTSELQRRLAAVEQTATGRTAAAAELGPKLEAAERRLAGLDDLRTTVNQLAEGRLAGLDDLSTTVNQLREAHAALREAQGKLAGNTQALEERLSKPDAANEVGTRVTKLEETLAAISAAATNDPQSGVPQLAAITGKLNDLQAALNTQLPELRTSLTQEINSRVTPVAAASEAARSKLSDLESTLNTQLAALRTSLTQEIDARVAPIAEASEAASTGTQRIDRELASAKENAARLAQQVEALIGAANQLEQTVRTAGEERTGLRGALEALKGSVTAQLVNIARLPDVNKAIEPITSKVTALEETLQGVVKSEDERKAHAGRILLALELANLRRALDGGGPYAAALAEVKKFAGGNVDLAALERSKDEGVPTPAELQSEFRAVSRAVLDAEAMPADASVVDRLLMGAKSIVDVRRTDHGADETGPEAILGRMEKALKDGKPADALAAAQQLSPKARAAAKPWLDKLEARSAVDRAIVHIEDQLKASLAGKG